MRNCNHFAFQIKMSDTRLSVQSNVLVIRLQGIIGFIRFKNVHYRKNTFLQGNTLLCISNYLLFSLTSRRVIPPLFFS